jgi:phosphoglycerate dehydrogenase-like enzyme
VEEGYKDYIAALQPLDASLLITAGDNPETLVTLAAECPVWLGQPNLIATLLRLGCKPQWVQSTWAGIRPLLAAGLPQNYQLTRAVGVFGQLMSEYVLTYMLAHERQLIERYRGQEHRQWDARTPGTLVGRRILIAGAGDIGGDVARFLAPFGVELHGIAREPRPMPHFTTIQSLDALPQAVREVDYLINLLPDTPQTRDLYTLDLYRTMKPSALFINAGRGSAVVEADLISALKQRLLAGAVLDVFREEPLPDDHEFWSTPGLIITSHTAAVSSPAHIAQLFVENLKRFGASHALKGQVDFQQGY